MFPKIEWKMARQEQKRSEEGSEGKERQVDEHTARSLLQLGRCPTQGVPTTWMRLPWPTDKQSQAVISTYLVAMDWSGGTQERLGAHFWLCYGRNFPFKYITEFSSPTKSYSYLVNTVDKILNFHSLLSAHVTIRVFINGMGIFQVDTDSIWPKGHVVNYGFHQPQPEPLYLRKTVLNLLSLSISATENSNWSQHVACMRGWKNDQRLMVCDDDISSLDPYPSRFLGHFTALSTLYIQYMITD